MAVAAGVRFAFDLRCDVSRFACVAASLPAESPILPIDRPDAHIAIPPLTHKSPAYRTEHHTATESPQIPRPLGDEQQAAAAAVA